MDQETLFSNIENHGIPSFWSNTAQMQEAYSLEVKGWMKYVHWKESTIPKQNHLFLPFKGYTDFELK